MRRMDIFVVCLFLCFFPFPSRAGERVDRCRIFGFFILMPLPPTIHLLSSYSPKSIVCRVVSDALFVFRRLPFFVNPSTGEVRDV